MKPASFLRSLWARAGPPDDALALAWAVGAAALVLLLQALGALRPLERAWYDLAASSGARFAVRDVALVEIDDASVARLGPWPWPREQLARVVERVGVAGARSIVVVEDLSGPPDSPALAQAIARNGRTLLALRPLAAAGAASGAALAGGTEAAASAPGNAGRAPLAALAAGAIALGHVDWLTDSDGVARRAVLVAQGDGFPEPALALLAAARQRDPQDKGRPVVDGRQLRLGPHTMALDDDGALAPRWTARGAVPAGSRESALSLLSGQIGAARYAGKVVLIGPTLPGAAHVHTPARDAVPLVEAVAELTSALLEGQVMHSPRGAGVFAVLLALAGALGVVILAERYSAASSWAWVGAAAVLALAGSSVLVQLSGWWLPLLVPALAWLAALAALQWWRRHASAAGAPAGLSSALGSTASPAASAPLATAAVAPANAPADDGFAATVVEPHAAPVAAMLGRYPLVREAARGALGSVYLARDPQTQYPVAIKTVALSDHFDGEALASMRRELERSAEAAAALRHPDIAATLDCAEDGGLDYVVCEWLEGEDLARLFKAGATQSVTGLLRTVARVAKAVAYAHRQGVIHGALRPSQVMVDAATHRVMLVGLAAAPVVRRVALRTGVGSALPYLAPELLAGTAGGGKARRGPAAPTPAADVYGLAALLHHGLTGQPPARRRAGAADLRGLRADLPDALRAVLARGLDPRPQARPRDALAFAEAVQAVLEAMGGAVSRPQVLPDVN